jgi:hypothetical protein
MRNDGNRTPRASRLALGAALCAALACGTASAVTLEQAPIGGGDAFLSSIGAGNLNLDNFVVAAESQLVSVSWWGSRIQDLDASDDGEFEVALFRGMEGTPDVNPFRLLPATVLGEATGIVDLAGAPVLKYTAAVPAGTPNLLLPATYYIAVAAKTGEWYWQFGAPGDGLNWFREESDDAWISGADFGNFSDLAFSLDLTPVQAIPEPGSVALVALGAFGLLALARRRTVALRREQTVASRA